MRYITNVNDLISSPLRGTKVTKLLPYTKYFTLTHSELGYKSKITSIIVQVHLKIPIYNIVPKYDHVIVPTKSSYYRKDAKLSSIHI
jgi:hypothetical protein